MRIRTRRFRDHHRLPPPSCRSMAAATPRSRAWSVTRRETVSAPFDTFTSYSPGGKAGKSEIVPRRWPASLRVDPLETARAVTVAPFQRAALLVHHRSR